MPTRCERRGASPYISQLQNAQFCPELWKPDVVDFVIAPDSNMFCGHALKFTPFFRPDQTGRIHRNSKQRYLLYGFEIGFQNKMLATCLLLTTPRQNHNSRTNLVLARKPV
jgi:hypothetical protein